MEMVEWEELTVRPGSIDDGITRDRVNLTGH